MRLSHDDFLSVSLPGFEGAPICAINGENQGRPIISRKTNILKSSKAMKRLNTLKSVYGTPQRLRDRMGLRRKSLSPSQKFLRMFVR